MSGKIKYHYDKVSWLNAADEIMEVRRKVFVIEQRFSKEIVCDHVDHKCFHILVRDQDNQPIGCGRLSPTGRVSKIAVTINHRGYGVGSEILSELIHLAKQSHINNLTLNAETDLTHFYFQKKFSVDGPVYMKQGVPHQRLVKRLA
ncbi:GNAT family N-acetyltransferase [Aliikangiella marina]|uniref:GNAT family N-acetyltransferase n=1 Tax=Aliikangiella marina TaxID=1712262 RepID=A0A545TIX5_9GAMM|nr:GNAT family N-acetyltransferase [Aliikangiella marina]TQV77131.1 GNAT family N-acetyltransferase [Aliikangiella marina]